MILFRKTRRRRAGIYVVRTRRHRGRGREVGYVGQSNYVDLRKDCHFGQCRHTRCVAKDWIDLDPVWHVLTLPWWLSFKPIQNVVEYVAIKTLLPRYNVTHNKTNPRWVPPSKARAQRLSRDRVRRTYGRDVADHAGHIGRALAVTFGVVLIVVGTTMAIVTNT